MNRIHVVGAGLAGLSAALSLTSAGRSVIIHEAGPAAGGRCRSYFDKELGLRIDNGNHLLLSGNTAAMAYIAEIHAEDRFNALADTAFPFIDLQSNDRWTIRPNKGRIPWWIFKSETRVPETKLSDYLQMAGIVRIRDDTLVADSMRRGQLYRRLLEPLAIAALNTPANEGLARLLGPVLRETLAKGADACCPMLPKEGLSEALIDPAIAALRACGAEIRYNSRITRLAIEEATITSLRGPDGPTPIYPGDSVVLAVPPWSAADLLPDLVVPDAFQAILNIHFGHCPDLAAQPRLIGLIGGTAEWVFTKPNHVSVTISAANRMVDETALSIATLVWPNVVDALGLDASLKQTIPPYRVVKEKRATFAATAKQERRRPNAATRMAANLALAGDWTNTGLPATIEGAIRSGRSAADVVLSR